MPPPGATPPLDEMMRRHAPAALPPGWLAERLLLRTESVLILDKPAGLPVHATRPGVPSLHAWLPALRLGKRYDPQPAHRLDADTAGCLALGRTRPALAALGRLFAERQVVKTYWAVVRGTPMADAGTIDAPIAKTSTARTGWRMVVRADGQPAQTGWRLLGRGDGIAWLELTPETGRTHQLRLHCAYAGWPILGDPLYGTGAGSGRLHLLARHLRLPLAPALAATAAPPPHMHVALAACGWRG
jgi:RluA family pseudouridine synthase